MKRRMFFVSLLSMIFVLAFFTPALAEDQGPEIVTFEFDDVPFVVDCDIKFGKDFKAHFVDDIRFQVKTFFDSDGIPIRFLIHAKFDGTVTRSDNNALGFQDKSNVIISGELPIDDEISESELGLLLRLKTPGEKVVVLQVGRIAWDADGVVSFLAGQNMDEDFEELTCDALAELES